MSGDATWEVRHNHRQVASGCAPTVDAAVGQALHYHRMYGQDGGPCRTTVTDAKGEVVLRAFMNLPEPQE